MGFWWQAAVAFAGLLCSLMLLPLVTAMPAWEISARCVKSRSTMASCASAVALSCRLHGSAVSQSAQSACSASNMMTASRQRWGRLRRSVGRCVRIVIGAGCIETLAKLLGFVIHRLRTAECKKLYAMRKETPSRCSASSNWLSVSANFCCAGSTRSGGEWSLVIMAWNMKRMFALSPAT
jgi:hypothetical protein